ncbi:hypothetical protein [Mycobacterium sp. ACS1612]|uniref:hypothetical protein n=1 Tax=Mycobacterium sp. ACS1612 TaxID=1834117 RepID=UPI000AD7BAFC|nr:hypothetical protein [Mycobacterium sp. ACS1612]
MTSRFKAPNNEQVKEVLRRIPTLQLRRAFFEGIKNPLWVKPLAEHGIFSSPPEPEVTDDGLVRDVYWPEIDYLIRAAPDVPEAVVDVLLKLGKSNNAWVRRGAFAIGAAIPAEQAARLEPLIKSWKSTGMGWRTDPRDLVAVVANLFQGGQTEVGKWLAGVIFKPTRGKDRLKPATTIEDYWYELGLSKLVAAIGNDGLAVVLPWLIGYERMAGKLKKDYDNTHFSRESIRKRSHDHEDVEQALIEAVRDLAIRAMLVDAAGATGTLLQTNMLLGRKLALFSLGEAIRQTDGADPHMIELLDLARTLLFDELSLHYSCRIDYAELARAVANVSPRVLDDLPGFIERGCLAESDRRREQLRGDGEESADIDEQVQEYGNLWKHSWLSAIGREALPAQLQATLADLDRSYGVIDAPLEPAPIVWSWSGPNSPLRQDDMAAMSATELINHLESWHDAGDGWGPEPSHEGQGRELTALLTGSPKAVAGVGNLVDRLRPTYLRAIVSGWRDAAKAGIEPDWTQLIEVIGGILEHDDQSPFPPEGGHGDDDPDFRSAKRAAVGLLEQLAKPQSKLVIPEGVMPQVAELIIGSFSDEIAWDGYIASAGSTGMDAFTTSLNWQWPMGIRGLTYLMAHGTDTIWYQSARSTLMRELSRDDIHGASSAAVGEGVGRLLMTDPEWLETNASDFFGSEVGLSTQQQIALTTAITTHHYNVSIFKLLSSSMTGAIRLEQPVVAGWRTQFDPLQRIGDWVINAIIRGHNTIEESPAREFFSVVPPKVRGDAIGHVGWAFTHAQAVDDPIRNRLAELWDSRVAHVQDKPDDREELAEFCWFVKCHKFAVEWWLPRLKQAIELCPDVRSESHMIGKEIAFAADLDPHAALEVLKMLLEGQDESGLVTFELMQDAVPTVIARAIASGDESLKQDAMDYMNELGEKGHFSLEAEVAKFL